MDKKNKMLTFSAIDKYIEENVILPTETDINNQKFGDGNKYPTFIYDAYFNSTTLKTVVQSVIDYVVGDDVESTETVLTKSKLEKLVFAMAHSYAVFGGFALNILRNRIGGIADIVPVDMRCLRTNKDNTVFYYSEDYCKRSYGRSKYVTYEKFDKTRSNQFSSIFYYKNTMFQTYPSPIWSAAVNSALIDAKVGEFHLNNLTNGFAPNFMICMNNGVPTDEVMEEIEESFNEKFTGTENAGRVLIAYSNDKDHSPSIEQINVQDFADKYKSLVEYSKEQIYSSFRINEVLLGINRENGGFSDMDFAESYKLFNRTMVKSIQKIIVNTFDEIFDREGVISIKPFSFEGDTEKLVEN